MSTELKSLLVAELSAVKPGVDWNQVLTALQNALPLILEIVSIFVKTPGPTPPTS